MRLNTAPTWDDDYLEIQSLRFHFEDRLCTEKADIELKEKVDLSQDDRNAAVLCPRKGEPNRRKSRHSAGQHQCPSLRLREVARQLNRRGLLVPVCTELHSYVIWQHIDGCSRVEQCRNLNRRLIQLQR